MNKQFLFSAIAALAAVFAASAAERRLPLATYRDKMKAAWIGQIAGVAMGAPTEFKYNHKIMPADQWKPWRPEMINNAFDQDDVYVEITFLQTLATYGYGVSQRQVAIDFANSQYRLWHANAEGRNQLRQGVAPPDSANPRLNKCANDIDYQIESDFSGIVAPGCPQAAIALGEKFVIPVKRPTPSPLEDYKNPKPLANAKFTPEEMAKILFASCAWGHQSPKKP